MQTFRASARSAVRSCAEPVFILIWLSLLLLTASLLYASLRTVFYRLASSRHLFICPPFAYSSRWSSRVCFSYCHCCRCSYCDSGHWWYDAVGGWLIVLLGALCSAGAVFPVFLMEGAGRFLLVASAIAPAAVCETFVPRSILSGWRGASLSFWLSAFVILLS